MKTKWILSIIVICLSAGCDSVPTIAGEGERYHETEGGFSVVPPDGWLVTRVPGLQYKIFTSIAPANGFAPNINLLDETYPGSLNDYTALNLSNLQKVYPDFARISEEELTLDSGLHAVKIVTKNSYDGQPLEQTYYMIEGSRKMFVMTCSKHARDERNLDKVFEISARSFREEN